MRLAQKRSQSSPAAKGITVIAKESIVSIEKLQIQKENIFWNARQRFMNTRNPGCDVGAERDRLRPLSIYPAAHSNETHLDVDLGMRLFVRIANPHVGLELLASFTGQGGKFGRNKQGYVRTANSIIGRLGASVIIHC